MARTFPSTGYDVDTGDFGNIFAGLDDLEAGPVPVVQPSLLSDDREDEVAIPLIVPRLADASVLATRVVIRWTQPALATQVVIERIQSGWVAPAVAPVVTQVIVQPIQPVLAVFQPIQNQPIRSQVKAKRADPAEYERVRRLSTGPKRRKVSQAVTPEEMQEQITRKRARDKASRKARELKDKQDPQGPASRAAAKEARRLADLAAVERYDQRRILRAETELLKQAARREKSRNDMRAKRELAMLATGKPGRKAVPAAMPDV
jgi:hypothetical protein